MNPEVDVLIPTSKMLDRLGNLLFQIRAVFAQGLDARVTIGMEGEYPELMQRLTEEEREKMRFIKDAPRGALGNAAILHCMEVASWADWFYAIGDDDALLPWGLRHLYDNRKDVSMVIGQVLCVTKGDHKDLTAWKVGEKVEFCRVSGVCALFNFRDIERLAKPWWNPHSAGADCELIARMAMFYPYRIIPNTVCVLPLDETQPLSRFVSLKDSRTFA